MTYLIYDLVVAAILLFFYLRGRKKGLILTLCGLVAIFVAFAGAHIISEALTPTVADALTPRFSTLIEERLGDSLDGKLDTLLDAEGEGNKLIADLLKTFGIYDKVANAIRDTVTGEAAQTVADVALSLARAVAEVVAGVLIFVVAFLVIFAGWFLLSHGLDLAARLPVIHGLNRLLGGLFGLGEGMLILFLLAWVLRVMGGIIPQDVVEQTTILRFFYTTNPLELITGI